MPYIATFEALKSRAKAIDPEQSSEIDHIDVGQVAVLVDRYPAIVPTKYAKCACECNRDDGPNEWLVEFDASTHMLRVEPGVGYRDALAIAMVAVRTPQTTEEDTTKQDLQECLRSFLDLIESAGGPSVLATEGAPLGKTVYAVKLYDRVARAKDLLS